MPRGKANPNATHRTVALNLTMEDFKVLEIMAADQTKTVIIAGRSSVEKGISVKQLLETLVSDYVQTAVNDSEKEDAA